MTATLREDTFDLSPIQQGMLFHHLLDPASGTDIEQMVIDLDEAIQPAELEQAWQRVVDHRSALRLSFEWDNLDQPQQRENPRVVVPLERADWRGLDAEVATAQYLTADRRKGFDLRHAPLLRLALFQLDAERFRLIWSFHHILIDGRSFEIILRDVFQTYESILAGKRVDLPFDRSYRNYVAWIKTVDPAQSTSFWRDTLKGFQAPTSLPYDHDLRAGNERFGQEELQLTPAATSALRAFAESEGITLNTLIMGVWALLLSRYHGERDIVFGATRTTRYCPLEGVDSMLGLFLSTIPVRIHIDPELSVKEWLKRLRKAWVSLRGHDQLPLVNIKELSELPAGIPLFDSLVVFENYLFGNRLREQGGNWIKRRFQLFEQTNYPLTFLGYGDNELLLKIDYDRRRFEAATIRRLLSQLRTMLEAMPEARDVPLYRLPVLDVEQRQVLEQWIAAQFEYPRDRSLAQLIEEQVERTPAAVAVIYGDEQITYRELNDRANQLAHELRKHGAGPDALVGISLERSIDMMITLLAVIKSGSAYMPLDPYFPADRLAYMVEDSGLRILVTEHSLRSMFPAYSGAVIEVGGAGWRQNPRENILTVVEPENLAYVIYTSGSTGKPKGVQVTRGALLNLLWSMREWLALKNADRLLAVTTISFDIASVDIWLPWLVGAQTILASREQAAEGEQLRDLLERHDVTFLQATPITWRLLLEAGWQGKQNLQIVCTGEALPRELAAKLHPLVPRFWNLYGPTETTIWSTGYLIEHAEDPVLIGKPVANTSCYILDEFRQPVPLGAIGELYIGGEGLARDYLNQPKLTAEKFLPDPFSAKPGARMYRTGDLARYRADGNIECLGRTDHQVKIRGFRIELGEIETVLKDHHKVKQAVAVAREDLPGDRRLIAYVVPETGSGQLSRGELRTFLKQRLPDYMIPADFITLAAIPISSNGKIDRKALPAPELNGDAVVDEASYVAPRTLVEEQLAEIWRRVFQRDAISVRDNFFDLGGNSLLAVRLMSNVSKTFQQDFPLNVLFTAPTIEQIAVKLGSDKSIASGRHHLIFVRSTGSRPPLYWIPGGAAIGMFSKDVADALSPDQPIYWLGSRRPASIDEMEDAPARAAAYLRLVREVQPKGPYCFTGFCLGGRIAFEMAQQVLASGDQVGYLGMVNSWFPNFPPGRAGRALLRAQRLGHQFKTAARNGGVVDYLRQKFKGRVAVNQERAMMREAEKSMRERGVGDGGGIEDEVLAQAAFQRMKGYVPRPFPGQIHIFLSEDRDLLGVSEDLDPRLAWRSVASCEVHRLAGDHAGVLKMPHAAEFARTLDETLAESLATAVSS